MKIKKTQFCNLKKQEVEGVQHLFVSSHENVKRVKYYLEGFNSFEERVEAEFQKMLQVWFYFFPASNTF